MVRRLRGGPSRRLSRLPRLFLRAPSPARSLKYRLESLPASGGAEGDQGFSLKALGASPSTAGLFNIQFHSGLRRNETSGLGICFICFI
jgi:hypothetical protein